MRRQRRAHAVRILRSGVERVSAVGGVVDAERAARLDRIGGDAVVDQADRGDVLGAGERGVGCRLVAERDGDADIAVRAIAPRFSAPSGCAACSRSTTAGSGS